MHLTEVRETFAGEMFTTGRVHGPTRLDTRHYRNFGNSGAGAISLAELFGAERIYLLGYDCHKRGGSHWHGDHPKGLRNAGSIGNWPKQFADLAAKTSALVVNCSPGTALKVFPTGRLDEVLNA